MRRTLSNRPVAMIAGIFSVPAAVLLHANPFGDGEIPWPGAIVVALAGNLALAFLVASWTAPYLASSGGREGARNADPRAVAIAERGMAAALMVVALAALFAVDFASRDLIVTPTQRAERNAELVRDTVRAKAPSEFQQLLTAADTWKLSERTYRTCVPSATDRRKWWCVLARGGIDELRVVQFGPGISNAEQFLRWHPELRRKRGAD